MFARRGRTGKTLVLNTVCLTAPGDPLPAGACSYKVLRLEYFVGPSPDAAMTELKLHRRFFAALQQFVHDNQVPGADVLTSRGLTAGEAIDVLAILEDVVRLASADGSGVCVLADEYDRLINTLMMEDPVRYHMLMTNGTARAASSPINAIYEWFKDLDQAQPLCRTFSTGITPIAVADATGANTVQELSRNEQFADILGFREDAVVAALQLVPGLTEEQLSLILHRMRLHYNGYRHLGRSQSLYSVSRKK